MTCNEIECEITIIQELLDAASAHLGAAYCIITYDNPQVWLEKLAEAREKIQQSLETLNKILPTKGEEPK